jgi:cytochrome c
MKTKLALLIAAGFVATAHAEGDPAQGERVFTRCVACHSLEPGQNRVGPSLHAIMDNPSASVEGFNYSAAMQAADLVWDDETMHEYLRDPRGNSARHDDGLCRLARRPASGQPYRLPSSDG